MLILFGALHPALTWLLSIVAGVGQPDIIAAV
jgi:hypothetical protein